MTIQYLHELYLTGKRRLIKEGYLPRSYPFYMMGRKKVIFLHIPKTAGTSIRNTLFFNPPFRGIDQYGKHHTTREILYLIGKEEWDAAFTFCFVRNPWGRLLSQHNYFVRKKIISGESVDFNYWAKKSIDYALEFDPLKKQNKHFYPACDWMKDEHNNLLLPDFIGKFETVGKDFQLICEKLNWKPELKRMNIAPQKLNHRDHYDTALNDLVHLFYKEDIERFDYVFE